MGQTEAFTTAGTLLGVSANAPTTFDDDATTGYPSLTYTDIGEITDFGEVGRVYNEITHNPVGTRETFKFKGSYNEGGLTLQMAKAPSNAGQAILNAALNSDEDYYFKLELNDNPGGTSNTILYLPGKVMSAPDSIGNADSIVSKTVQVSVSGSIVEVAAVA